MTACFALGANCQNKIDWKEEYRQAISVIARLKKDSSSLSQLIQDTTMLRQRIALKQQEVNAIHEQMIYNREMVDTLTSIREQQAGLIATLDKAVREDKAVIETLQKRKVTVWRQVVQFFAGVGVGVIVGKL